MNEINVSMFFDAAGISLRNEIEAAIAGCEELRNQLMGVRVAGARRFVIIAPVEGMWVLEYEGQAVGQLSDFLNDPESADGSVFYPATLEKSVSPRDRHVSDKLLPQVAFGSTEGYILDISAFPE